MSGSDKSKLYGWSTSSPSSTTSIATGWIVGDRDDGTRDGSGHDGISGTRGYDDNDDTACWIACYLRQPAATLFSNYWSAVSLLQQPTFSFRTGMLAFTKRNNWWQWLHLVVPRDDTTLGLSAVLDTIRSETTRHDSVYERHRCLRRTKAGVDHRQQYPDDQEISVNSEEGQMRRRVGTRNLSEENVVADGARGHTKTLARRILIIGTGLEPSKTYAFGGARRGIVYSVEG
ncbi:uncharacterized protein EV420DRAFT_1472913 [Desarmillaria tabescens]|uniref:Uncharacterized protein n=1 Tax=Armillaria tabescens TaxID=1929756 RepID=A0AA39NQH0_ARMTA|nr:uncharacterized protein EV420DRAFT_1472913 [Desarmillaria tabescens]KAK0469744.1 hypothetical protein EV420DRAFT_1472913 [Desarmillaria tabescens]